VVEKSTPNEHLNFNFLINYYFDDLLTTDWKHVKEKELVYIYKANYG